jgi:ElaB/YqjD/DUF883 family membrane-anchored ribosome-binding protein
MEQSTNEQSARALEREIEHDREEIDRTMTQLQEKLSVEHLVDETRTYLSDWIRSASDLVTRHPLPAVGVALLAGGLLGRSRARRRAFDVFDRNGRAEVEQLVQAIVDRAVEASQAASRAAANGNGAAHAVSSGAEDVIRRLTDMLEETGRRLQAGVPRAQEAVGDAVGRAQDAIDILMRNQPMTLGAIGLVLGTAAITVLARRRSKETSETREEATPQWAAPPASAPSPTSSSRFATTIPSG